MSGEVAVRQVLAAASAVTTLVPSASIIADDTFPQNSALPIILLKTVSTVDLNIPNPGAKRFTRERVQATIYAATASSRLAIRRQVRKALDSKAPTVSGLTNVTIHLDGAGANFIGAGDIRIGVQDTLVTFSEER